MRIGITLIGVMLWTGAGAAALAQTWSVTTADFQRLDGELKAVDDAGLRMQTGTTERALPWEQIVAAEQPGARLLLGADPFVLVTRDGQRIVGTPARFADDKLTWRSQMLGVLESPIENVAGIVQLASQSLPDSSGQEDLVVLANGDQLRGIIEPDPEGGLVVQQEGTSAKVPWDTIRSIVLAQTLTTPGPAEAAGKLRIRLTDGSTCLATKLHRDGQQLHIERQAGELKLPLATIASIANEGGKVHFLAGLKPKDSLYAPYVQISDQQPSALRVLDEVAVDGRAYRSVLQVRPRTTLTYTSDVEGKLHLRYACAHPGELTDMAIKLLVNAKPVHEVQSIASPAASEAIETPVKVGDTITIEVEYGKNFDIQDWLLLLEAALVAQ